MRYVDVKVIDYEHEGRISAESLLEHNFPTVDCFWLITTGRSGTLRLAYMLDALRTIDACHEPWPALTYEGRLAIEGKPLPDEAAIRLLHNSRARFVEGSYKRYGNYFECSLFLSHIAEQIKKAFTAARFVHLIRHPKKFIVSGIAKNWVNRDTVIGHLWPNVPDESWETWQRLAWLWNEIHSKGLDLENKYGPVIVHRLLAEDLYENVESFDKLLMWMGCNKYDAQAARGNYWDQMVNKSENDDKPKWAPAWNSFLEETCGETMSKIYG